MLVRFTNCFGEVNYGVIVARDIGGMVLVDWEPYTALLERLTKRGPLSDFVSAGLGAHRSWVRVETPLPNGAKFELLEKREPVLELATAQQHSIAIA